MLILRNLIILTLIAAALALVLFLFGIIFKFPQYISLILLIFLIYGIGVVETSIVKQTLKIQDDIKEIHQKLDQIIRRQGDS